MKFLTFILLVLLIAHSSLNYLSQEFIILHAKIEAHLSLYSADAINNSLLIKVVPKGTKIDDEVRIGRRLYDVVKQEEKNDSVYCFGIEDKSEEEADFQLALNFQQGDNGSGLNDLKSSAHHRILPIIDRFYTQQILTDLHNLTLELISYSTITFRYFQVSFDIITPPPELSSI